MGLNRVAVIPVKLSVDCRLVFEVTPQPVQDINYKMEFPFLFLDF